MVKFCYRSFLSLLLFVFILPLFVDGVIKRCFKCRSRGDLGSCKDTFGYNNASALENVHGVSAIPCASGWCGKVLEGGANAFKDEEYGMATERLCLQRGPSDDEERCAPTVLAYTKVMMCFCQGDLCNNASVSSWNLLNISLVLLVAQWFR